MLLILPLSNANVRDRKLLMCWVSAAWHSKFRSVSIFDVDPPVNFVFPSAPFSFSPSFLRRAGSRESALLSLCAVHTNKTLLTLILMV
jgi:hypothetical protein